MQTHSNSSQIEVFQLSGHINASNVEDCQKSLTDALSSSTCTTFLADMQHVESLDSAGLMALVAALNYAQEQDKTFTLINVSDELRIIFELTQLDQVFTLDQVVTAPQLAAA